MADLPTPISDQDLLLHNIALGYPDVEDLIPTSRQEVYLKYIALNGGTGGNTADVNVVQTTGTSTSNVMSQNAVTKELDKKVDKDTTINGKSLSDDIELTAEDIGTYTKKEIEDKISENSINVVQETGTSTTDVMSQNAITDELKKLGTSAYCNTGISAGNVPIINSDGKLDNSIIPSLALTDTFIANNEDEMLNIQGAEQGDICIRTDENKTYILDKQPAARSIALTATDKSEWIEILTPTSDVSSVNGKKGDVELTAEDLNTYTKEEIENKIAESGGGSSITVVQERGRSTTDVMSQKAVSENTCFGYEAEIADNSVSIGYRAKSKGYNCTSIGDDAVCEYPNSFAIGPSANSLAEHSGAIGYFSKSTEEYTISFGNADMQEYSLKRLVNVADPINAQDVVTKNYVDCVVLYENSSGTQSTITLSDRYDYYKRIKIHYSFIRNTKTMYGMIEFYPGESLTNYINISTSFPNSRGDTLEFKVCSISFYVTTVTFDSNAHTKVTSDSVTSDVDTDNLISINKIVGYKF